MRWLLALLWAAPAAAAPMSITDASLDVYRVVSAYDPYQPDYSTSQLESVGDSTEVWTLGTALNLGLRLFNLGWGRYALPVHWDHRIHGRSTQAQFRHVGWEWDLTVGEQVQFLYHHHSQHALESQPAESYPLEDYVGLRLRFTP